MPQQCIFIMHMESGLFFFKYCIVIKLTDLKKNLECKTLQQKENSNFACAQTTNVMIKIDTNFINLKVETKLKNQ